VRLKQYATFYRDSKFKGEKKTGEKKKEPTRGKRWRRVAGGEEGGVKERTDLKGES